MLRSNFGNSRRTSRVAFELLEDRCTLSVTFVDSGPELPGIAELIAVVDVDGDNDLDVIDGGWIRDSLFRVWSNDGSGNLTVDGTFSADGRALAIGDVDGDGDRDAYVTGDDVASTWLNDGQGRFFKNERSLPGLLTSAARFGDLDGDGDSDLLTAGQGDGSFRIGFNNGQGDFNQMGNAFGNVETSVIGMDLLLGDLDDDGDTDFLYACFCGFSSTPYSKWLNDGNGTFSNEGHPFEGDSRRVLESHGALGDLDADGDLDAIVSNRGIRSVWLNDGKSSFSNSGQLDSSTEESSGSPTVIADFDADNDLDILADSRLWLNDGHASFTDSGQLFPFFARMRTVQVGDLDGDGDFDVVGASRVFLNEKRTVAIWHGDAMIGAPGDDHSWEDPSNWTLDGEQDALPIPRTPGSDILIPARGTDLVNIHLSGDESINSLTVESDAVISGGHLNFTYGGIDVADGVSLRIDSDVNSIRKSGQGTITLNGNVADTLMEEGRLEGHGTLAALVVNSAASVSPGVGTGTLSVNGNVAIEGRLTIDVGVEIDVLSVPTSNAIVLEPDSALHVTATEGLGQVGHHRRLFATAGFISRRFGSEPVVGRHVGFGVFTARAENNRNSTVAYGLRSVEIALFQAAPGDANGNGQFDRDDVIQVLQAGRYLDGQFATWTEGDWNSDGIFDQLDLVSALENSLR